MWSRKRQAGLNESKFVFGSGMMDHVFQQNGGEAQDHARRDECFDDPYIAPYGSACSVQRALTQPQFDTCARCGLRAPALDRPKSTDAILG